jgi:N-acetylmuramoyl-L-alanine amidase
VPRRPRALVLQKMSLRRRFLFLYAVLASVGLTGTLLLDPAWSAQNKTNGVKAEGSLEPDAKLAQQAASIGQPSEQEGEPASSAVVAPLDPNSNDADCIAKVIVHEAANQSHLGKIAIAQVIHTRLSSPLFPKNACAVVKQRGQFFDIDAYNPSRTTALWLESVSIAIDSLNGLHKEIVPGALFFHAVGTAMSGRRRIAQIGGHVFYR